MVEKREKKVGGGKRGVKNSFQSQISNILEVNSGDNPSHELYMFAELNLRKERECVSPRHGLSTNNGVTDSSHSIISRVNFNLSRRETLLWTRIIIANELINFNVKTDIHQSWFAIKSEDFYLLLRRCFSLLSCSSSSNISVAMAIWKLFNFSI